MLALAWNILPVAVQRKTKCKYSVKQSLPNKKDEFLWFEMKPGCLTMFVSGNISRVCHIFTNIMFCTISGILVYIQIVHCQCVHAQMSSQQPAWEWRLTLSPKSPAPPRAGLMAYGQAMKGRSRWTALPIVYMHQCQHSHQLRPFILCQGVLGDHVLHLKCTQNVLPTAAGHTFWHFQVWLTDLPTDFGKGSTLMRCWCFEK